GSGIKIAIVDSGVDYAHPAIGQCPGPTCKIITGYDFVGDEYNGFNKPIEDHNPHDVCNGHGTTMAGIISGESAGLNGIAHKARLGIYRVLGCNGMTQPDIVVAALNM
ncbi:peptidase S8/S53 domain-containing protein, partial [Syncephalis plumigaleata]